MRVQIQTGFQLAEQGAAAALAHAEQVHESWGNRAYAILLEIAAGRRPFRTEEVRAAAEEKGLPNPPSARAWGSVINRASRAGKISRVGFTACDNPKAHSCNVSIWVGI